MTFKDRGEAGRGLGEKLKEFKGPDTVVMAIPRGAVSMAEEIARNLGAPLDVVLVHKIGAPDNPELAMGSVTEFGDIFPNEVAAGYALSLTSLREYAQKEIKNLQKRRQVFDKLFKPVSLEGRTVIIVDDGIATGATMVAAIHTIKKRGAARVIVAAAVAPPSAIELLQQECDEVVVLEAPERMFSVGLYFDKFEQVSDVEVERILSRSHANDRGKGGARAI